MQIDVFLGWQEEVGYYFTPKEAVHDPRWRKREKDMKPGTENYAAILAAFKPGRPSFDFLHYDGKSHYVGYETC